MTRYGLRYVVPVLAILVALGGQITVSGASALGKLNKQAGHYHQTWPFLDYPMYSKSSGPPVQTSTATLTATLDDGSAFDVNAKSLGMKFFVWRFQVVERLVAEPLSAEEKPELASLIEEHRLEAYDRVIHQVHEKTGRGIVDLTVSRKVYTLVDGQLEQAEQVQHVSDPRALTPSAQGEGEKHD